MSTDGSRCQSWCGVASTASTTVDLGGVAQRGLNVGHMLIDALSVEAMSGVMVASTVVVHGKVNA